VFSIVKKFPSTILNFLKLGKIAIYLENSTFSATNCNLAIVTSSSTNYNLAIVTSSSSVFFENNSVSGIATFGFFGKNKILATLNFARDFNVIPSFFAKVTLGPML
jgi:hypothetical protein